MNLLDYYESFWKKNNYEPIEYMLHDATKFSYKKLGDIKQKKVLEIGCGSGVHSIQLLKRGAKLFAIDISEKSIDLAKNRVKKNGYSASFKRMDAQNLEFTDKTFDCVYINSVLMHVDKNIAIKEAFRVLKENGRLVIIEPMKHALFAFFFRYLSPFRKTNPRYVTYFKLKKMFPSSSHKEFNFFTCLLIPLFYLIKNRKVLNLFLFPTKALDKLFYMVPFFRPLYWITVVSTVKKPKKI